MNSPHFSHIDQLLADKIVCHDLEATLADTDSQIRHAPLLSGEIIKTSSLDRLPQYGFLGSIADEHPEKAESKIFLNTNIPFSAFICGVQGSGKSHSTSCILGKYQTLNLPLLANEHFIENALIPSSYLGRLENPVSALVFSYGEFSTDSAGFNISEAAYLSAPHPSFPGHRSVKKITVLTSPTNPQIKRLYSRIPNVTVMDFKLRASTLDIKTIHMLMNIDEKAETPLYMAKVQKILRQMAKENDSEGFDYKKFKESLALCNFNPTQLNMLEMRLDLLESFLDLSGKHPEPEFRPGEITIMDMSDPFMDANTACLMFKIGLQRYLQSKAPGKMVVLDEAHKVCISSRNSGQEADFNLVYVESTRRKATQRLPTLHHPTSAPLWCSRCRVNPGTHAAHRFDCSVLCDNHSSVQQPRMVFCD